MSIVKYKDSDLSLIKRTFAKDCNSDEFNIFVGACKQYGLDPFRKQIYAQVFNKTDEKRRQMAIVVGIDGLRSIASRNNDYRPDGSAPCYECDKELKSDTNPIGLVSCTVKAYKQDSAGAWHVVAGTAYWDEFAPVKDEWKNNSRTGRQVLSDTWKKMPRLMIAKVAEAQALRKGWPQASGLYAEEEVHRADMEDVTASEIVEREQIERKLKLINVFDAIMVQWEAGQSLEPIPNGVFHDKVIERLGRVSCEAELNGFVETNKNSFREFWAIDKDAALNIKSEIERIKAKLSEKDHGTGVI
jgi:phage recombination protein Bet